MVLRLRGAPVTLEPIFNADPLIKIHAATALTVVALGFLQFAAPKGTIPHRTIGWLWVVLMVVMLGTAFANHAGLWWGPLSTRVCCRDLACARDKVLICSSIHLTAIITLLSLPYAVLHARHNVVNHKRAMFLLVFGVMLFGTIFTTLPHRIMYDVIFK
jgi:uncharacterized membrane protein